MGGKGSGRPKGTQNKPSPYKQLERLKPTDLREYGHQVELSAKRYRHYAYNKGGQKYHTLVNIKDPTFSYRGVPEEQYQAHLKRLAKGDSLAYDKLWVYSKEGELFRAENARKGLISRIENNFMYETFNINGEIKSATDVIFDLEAMRNSQKWIDVALKNKSLIAEYWEGYHSGSGLAPPPEAGTIAISDFEDEINEMDTTFQESEQKIVKAELEKVISRLLK